ncbi:MAG: ABC transporter ATP-binding protein, partial [Alphaproteobacteria bacterium]|nr:ABC transporter ATP-binding protein [Alphaproteobacteria bacterium]
IAMAIANHPDILIADEPTTALDITIQSQIIELLLKLRRNLNMSLIFISHDLQLIRHIADKVIVMRKGKIVEAGTCKDIFENPQCSYTKTLIHSHSLLKTKDNKQNKIVLSGQDIIVKFPIKKSFLGGVEKYLYAVNHLSFNLFKGQTLGIVGESGSGKSTLGLAITKLLKYSGQIKLNNISIDDYTNLELRKKLQIVFQDPYNSLNPRMTVEQIVGEGLKVHYPELSSKEKQVKIIKSLSDVGLSSRILNKYPHEFSGGQRQRIAIARSLILNPQIMVLDEPTSALDVTIQRQIIELLLKLQQEHKLSYIFISHDMNAIRAVSDDIMVMKDGIAVECGSAEQIINHPQHAYTKELIKASELTKI